jgi:DNA-3-methyladenine glycosylase II
MHVITEHPGWAEGCRTLFQNEQTWIATTSPQLTFRPDQGLGEDAPMVDVYAPGQLSARVPAELSAILRRHGRTQRVRTPDLWEALATAIIRQVIRADQARKMYRRFCDAHGRPVNGAPSAFPRPRTVLDLSEQAFTDLGMKFKARPLRAAAEAFLEYGSKWAEMDPQVLVSEVQSVPRIGPWTAGAAVADFTGDFSLYPYGDMAVRTWAATATPHLDWPRDEATFAARWRSCTTTAAELSTLTVLTLALGGARGTEPPTT